MWISILEFLKIINDHYANLILLIIAIVSAIVAYREYSLRHRPYVVPEIVFEGKNTDWYFHVMLVNKGEFPAIAKIAQAILRIGDEEYSTLFKSEILLCPGEKQKLAPIGYIKEDGRNKILGHEYRNNKAEIEVTIDSKALGKRKFQYKTKTEYHVNVHGKDPVIAIIKEEMQ